MAECTGFQIKKIRNEKGMSQERFGEKIGVSGKSISAYETGKVIPPIKILNKISNTYEETIKTPNIKTKGVLLEKLELLQLELKDLKNSIENTE